MKAHLRAAIEWALLFTGVLMVAFYTMILAIGIIARIVYEKVTGR
jgi:hypothetical protein